MAEATFHDRAWEIADLTRIIESRRSELIIVYGRRGVGKSTLLAQLLDDRPHLYYQATTRTLPWQLEDLTAALRSFAPHLVLPGLLPSIDSLLDAVAQLARGQPTSPTIVVIDELPYLAQVDPAVPSVIQRWWDSITKEGLRNLKIFLLGSLVSWMAEQTLSEHAPLHNRRTGQLKLEPLRYREAALFYPRYPAVERVYAYAIWGGLPAHLERVGPDLGLWENVRAEILSPTSRLADEPHWLRFGDLRADAAYSSVLRAIAQGHRRPGEIARAVGKSRADEVKYHLERLGDLGLIERVVPIHESPHDRSRHALYRLSDHYLAFWYRYVDRLRHLLGLRRYDEALRSIQSTFDQYVSGGAFEDICRQFVESHFASQDVPGELRFDTVGSWWATTEEADEVDVVAMSEGRAVLVGECKWSRQPVGRRELEGLRAAVHRAYAALRPMDRPWRALFSRSGFSDELLALARQPEERLLLFTPDELYA